MRPLRRPVFWLVLGLGLGSGLGMASSAQRPHAASGLILGRVIDGTDGRPVPGATLSLTGIAVGTPNRGDSSGRRPPPLGMRVLADADGRFVFSGLPAGSFTITADAPGYQAGVHGQVRPGGAPRPVVLAANEKRGSVELALWRSGAVSGTVVDDFGEPVVGALVRVLRRTSSSRVVRFVPHKATYTDDRGAYRLFDLVPGNYVISARAPDAADEPDAVPDSRVQPTTFFPGTNNAGSAAVLSLASGEERSHVDILLAFVPGFRVSGTLLAPDGQPARAPIAVRLLPPDLDDFITDAGLEVASGVTTTDGHFEIDSVPAGTYQLRVIGVLQPTEPPLFAELMIDVPGGDVTGLSVPLRIGPRLRGRVEFDAGSGRTAPEPSNAWIRLMPADGRAMGLSSTRVETSGRFTTAPLLPGRYFVTAGASGWTLASAVLGGRDVADVPFEVATGDITGLVATFFDRPAELSGTVRNSRGEPDPSAVVLLMPVNYLLWIRNGLSPHRFRSAATGADGQYSVGGVLPGDYLVIAIEEALVAGTADRAQVVEAAAVPARRLTVAASARLRLNLTTVRVPVQ